MSAKLRNELLEVVGEGANAVVAWIAHDPRASYSRSVGPFVTRSSRQIASGGGLEFMRAVFEHGWMIAGQRHDRPALEDGRAVTGYVLEVAS